jgi:hypothetical protein
MWYSALFIHGRRVTPIDNWREIAIAQVTQKSFLHRMVDVPFTHDATVN